MQIPIAHPSLGREEAEAVAAALASGMIAQSCDPKLVPKYSKK